MQVGEDFLDAGFVARVGGGGPSIVGDVEPFPEGEEFAGDVVGVLLRFDAFFFSGFLDFLPMLIHAGEEVDFFAHHAVPACEDVREDFFVGVPDVGFSVRVIDRCCDVVHVGIIVLQPRMLCNGKFRPLRLFAYGETRSREVR